MAQIAETLPEFEQLPLMQKQAKRNAVRQETDKVKDNKVSKTHSPVNAFIGHTFL